MSVTIAEVNSTKFTCNGITYYKNFTPVVRGNYITIVNTYDNKIRLVEPTLYSEFTIDGSTYGTVALTQSALLDVIFTRYSLGSGGTAVWGSVTGNIEDQTDLIDYVAANGGGGSTVTIENDITINTTISGTQKGKDTVYPVNSSSAVEITVDKGTYAAGDVVIFSRKGTGTVNIERGTDVRLKGARNVNNQFFINDIGGYAAIVFEYLDGSTLVGNVTGDITRGYAGAVTTSSYGTFREGDTGVDVAVVGTGFSDNMLVTVSANATLNSYTVNSSTSLTLNMDAVGVETDTITVTYDNGDVYVDTDAITIAPATASELYNNYAFEYGWGLFKLKSAQTYGIKVRRSSDNATTDVGFNGSGKIALDSTVSAGGTLTSWASTDDVFIETMYNQGSVSGFDLTQSTTTLQPKFLSGGALITQSTVTMTEWDGSDDILATASTAAWANNDWTIFCNGNTKSATQRDIFGWHDSTGTSRMPFVRFNTTPAIQSFHPNDAGTQDILASGTLSTGTNYKVAAVSNGTGTALYINGSSVDTGVAPSSTPTDTQAFEMGGASEVAGTFLDGYTSYAVVYTSDEEANISAIETIIDSYL